MQPTRKGNGDAPVGTASHQHEELCTFYGGSGSILKNGEGVSNISALN